MYLPSKSNKQKNFFEISFLLASWRPMTKIADPDPDPLVRGMDPGIRIWIHTKISWIRNTDSNYNITWWISCRGRPCDCREWTRTVCPQTGLPAGSSTVSCTSRKIFKLSFELKDLNHDYLYADPTSKIFFFPNRTIKTRPGKKKSTDFPYFSIMKKTTNLITRMHTN